MDSAIKGVYITYRPPVPGDGTGAQVQRVAGIYGAARSLGLGYVHSAIAHIGPNPGDSFENSKVRGEFLADLNKLIQLPSDKLGTRAIRVRRDRLRYVTWRILPVLNAVLRHLRFSLIIEIESPYAWVDRYPSCYEFAVAHIRDRMLTPTSSAQGKLVVDVHIRRALVPAVSSSGIKYQRHLAIDWYIEILRVVASVAVDAGLELHIRVHTDSLKNDETWVPPSDIAPETIQLWESIGVLEDGRAIPTAGEDFESEFGDLGFVEVIQGLNPIDSWQQMMSADILLMGKSSFSFVAALLRGNGLVIASPFWHSLLPGWEAVSESYTSITEIESQSTGLKDFIIRALRTNSSNL